MRRIKKILVLVPLLLAWTIAAAQSWPAKSVRIIVAFPPGGVVDTTSRILAQELPAALGQQVVVENRPGAGSLIGTEYAAKAAPDGYSFYVGGTSALAINPHLYTKAKYNPLRDFAPITQLTLTSIVVCVNSSVPAKTVEQLVRLTAGRPNDFNYGSAGIASTFHIAMALFVSVTNAKLTHVPNKGSVEALTDMVAGRVQAMADAAHVFKAQVAAGTVRPIGVLAEKRSSLYPEVPTLEEQGYKGLALSSGSSIVAPAGTPDAILDRMNAEIVKILAKPAVRERFNELGMELVGNARQDHAARLASEYAVWGDAVKKSGAKIE